MWQPIETAPRDGTLVLMASTCGQITVGRQHPDVDWWQWSPLGKWKPTHWMPLPETPTHD